MRLFTAIAIPDSIRTAIAQACERLKSAAPGARWVRPESLHLTLKFIGEQPEDRLEQFNAALAKARAPGDMHVELKGLYFFPQKRYPRVLGVFVHPQETTVAMEELFRKIELHLAPLGVAREERGFRAHLTVARLDPRAKHDALDAALQAGPMRAEFGVFDTAEFHLYRSQLQRGGAVYTRLATFGFTS